MLIIQSKNPILLAVILVTGFKHLKVQVPGMNMQSSGRMQVAMFITDAKPRIFLPVERRVSLALVAYKNPIPGNHILAPVIEPLVFARKSQFDLPGQQTPSTGLYWKKLACRPAWSLPV